MSSNEKVPCVAIDGETISSTYNTTEFSHQNITQKMAKVVNDKNMMQLFVHKKKSQTKDISVFLPASLPFMQKISQLSDLTKGIITWKENAYIGEGVQIAGENKVLHTEAVELPINNYVFTDNQPDMNLLADLATTGKLGTVPELVENNNENISLITSTLPVDNNLPVTSNILVEQNINDEDETPLFNTMMVGFPLQNIPQRLKVKVNDHSMRYGENKLQLSEKNEPDMESSLAKLTLKSTLEPISKELKPQIRTRQQHIEHSVRAVIEPVTHQHIDAQPELAFAENEPFMQPVASLEITSLYDNKRTSFSENTINNFPDKMQETTVSPQISPVEEMNPPSNMIATTLNEAMRSSVPLQATQQKPEMHKMPELAENNSLSGENQQPKTAERSFTYTFSQWQSSPSVTFELASKGEFVASTASPEVQLALNENKHLLNHETSVHIRREDERQQHRNRQQHEQQQEED